MSNFVPATTKVRRSKVHHIPTARLLRRAARLRRIVYFESHTFPSRMQWAHRAAELHAIRVELARRASRA